MEVIGGSRNFEKGEGHSGEGDPTPRNSILGLKFLFLRILDGKFGAPSPIPLNPPLEIHSAIFKND
jgi:hypothetical protein